MRKIRTLILGAAGRDFHNFNTYCRNNDSLEVVGFTAAQIPDIDDRRYPESLAGDSYPDGIPIYDEGELDDLIRRLHVDNCIFSYSDIAYADLMHIAARVNSAGANFQMLGIKDTFLKSTKPVIAVCATRTGTGKSQTSRRLIHILMNRGLKVIAVRHPMPYGNLENQRIQRFAEVSDLETHQCTIEEMEEYEPHITRGNVIYAGVDYEAILRAAENDHSGCDVILWDGGNNDFPFFRPDLHITVTDPHRAGHGLSYYPGEISLRLADVVVINKIDSARGEDVAKVRQVVEQVVPDARIVEAASPVTVANPSLIRGKRVLVIEDGPTLTHGGMRFGAATIAARNYGAHEIIDPKPFLVGELRAVFQTYPHISRLLPAMGYSPTQLRDLEQTINNCKCDSVVIGTPIDLQRVITIDKPATRVTYELQEIGQPTLEEIVDEFITAHELLD